MAKYCSDCGNEIEETDKFCKSCGKPSSIKKIEVKKEDQKVTPHTEKAENKPTQSSLFLAIGVIVVVVVFLAGLYLFTSETRTVAISVPYQEAIYETRYSGTLKDTGLSTSSWTIKDATSYTYEYTGKDLWSQPEYTVKVCWGSSCTNYPEINDIGLDSNKFLIGYQTKYRTEYKSVTKTRLEWIISV